MDLCVFTDEISQDLEHALDVAAEYGVGAVELRGLWGRNIGALDDATAQRAIEIIRSRGLRVASLGSPFGKCDLPTDDMAEQMALLRRLADLAEIFDARIIRGFAFWRPEEVRKPVGGSGAVNVHLRKPDLPKKFWDTALRLFQQPARFVEERGLILAIENEDACGLGRGDETARFIEALGSANVRVAWDPGNAFFAGEAPYPDGYEQVRPHVVHFHAKDARLNPETGGAEWITIGEGDIDFAGQLRALAADGYRGAISLETHYTPPGGTREDGSRAGLAALRELLSVVRGAPAGGP